MSHTQAQLDFGTHPLDRVDAQRLAEMRAVAVETEVMPSERTTTPRFELTGAAHPANTRRGTQCERLLRFFEERQGQWVPLPEILALGIAQFGARILELRRSGYVIENRREHAGKAVHSWYRLVER